MIEPGGAICGRTSVGRSPAMVASRSCTVCRAARMSVPQSNSTTTDERPDARLRAHVLHAGRAEHRGLDREGHERLDFFRREAAALGHDRDARPVEVREHVDRHRRGQVRAVAERDEARDHDERPVLKRESDDAVEH